MRTLVRGQLLRARDPHPNAGMHAVVIADHAGGDFQTVFWIGEVRPQRSAFDPIALAHIDTWFETVDDGERKRLFPDGIDVPEFFVFPAQTL